VPVGIWAKIPEGAWLLFAILRFFVSDGLTAAVTPSLTVVVEFDADPPSHDRDELLRRLRLRRRFSRSGDLGGDQHGAIRRASRRHAGLRRSTVSRSPYVGRTGAVLIELGQHQAKPLDRVLAQRP